jgi:hypothetical protein
MPRGKHLSLEEARRSDKLNCFAKEHPCVGDRERFDRLLDAIVRGEPPASKKKRASGKASSSAERGAGSSGTRIRRGT